MDSLKHITPEMRKYLSNQKEWGKDELERPDFAWHILLESFATWGTARGHEGLIEIAVTTSDDGGFYVLYLAESSACKCLMPLSRSSTAHGSERAGRGHNGVAVRSSLR